MELSCPMASADCKGPPYWDCQNLTYCIQQHVVLSVDFPVSSSYAYEICVFWYCVFWNLGTTQPAQGGSSPQKNFKIISLTPSQSRFALTKGLLYVFTKYCNYAIHFTVISIFYLNVLFVGRSTIQGFNFDLTWLLKIWKFNTVTWTISAPCWCIMTCPGNRL